MSDLISLEAALDAVREAYENEETLDGYEYRLNELPSVEIIHCKDCKNSEHWYRDRRRCFVWAEEGVSVFDDGFCNYAERKEE